MKPYHLFLVTTIRSADSEIVSHTTISRAFLLGNSSTNVKLFTVLVSLFLGCYLSNKLLHFL